MAAPFIIIDMIRHVAQTLKGGRACSAGYPDLLANRGQMAHLFGADRVAALPVRADSDAIVGWHNVGDLTTEIFDAEPLFGMLGFSLDVIDINRARGNEIVVDLNRPMPDELHARYDLVVDTGTCEHCFNIGQAAMNLAGLVREGGYLIQATPLNGFNHGFYNVNPTWYHDFYPANGFEIEFLKGVSDIVRNPQLFDLPAFEGFAEAPRKSVMLMLARRAKMQPLEFPMQRKYVANPHLKG